MPKKYNDRAMSGTVPEKNDVEETAYFFPKANPPVTIKAKSREEAEEKLSALGNKE